MITHYLPVTAKMSFCIHTGFPENCSTLQYHQSFFFPHKWHFSAHMSLQIDLWCVMFYKMHNCLSLYFLTWTSQGRKKMTKKWLRSYRWVWLICKCGTGAVSHRMKINLGFLPNGHYNYWFSNPICHTHHPHMKMRLKNVAASICYNYKFFHFSLHFVENISWVSCSFIPTVYFFLYDLIIWKLKGRGISGDKAVATLN